MRKYIYLFIFLFFTTLGIRSVVAEDRQEVQCTQCDISNIVDSEDTLIGYGYTGLPVFPKQIYYDVSNEDGGIIYSRESVYMKYINLDYTIVNINKALSNFNTLLSGINELDYDSISSSAYNIVFDPPNRYKMGVLLEISIGYTHNNRYG